VRGEFALASGGITGLPTGDAVATVPEVHTDFILVAIGAQFGWLGALAVVALVATLICRCVLIALRVQDGFRSLLAVSLAALFAIQAMLIVGGTLRVLPLTGLTLPLVSYGGTSMVATLFVIGIIGGIGANARTTDRRSMGMASGPLNGRSM
jgi:cell division protein FtsW (lipid II flippase)